MRVRSIGVLITATLLFGSIFRGADTLPASITDPAYWKIQLLQISEQDSLFLLMLILKIIIVTV